MLYPVIQRRWLTDPGLLRHDPGLFRRGVNLAGFFLDIELQHVVEAVEGAA